MAMLCSISYVCHGCLWHAIRSSIIVPVGFLSFQTHITLQWCTLILGGQDQFQYYCNLSFETNCLILALPGLHLFNCMLPQFLPYHVGDLPFKGHYLWPLVWPHFCDNVWRPSCLGEIFQAFGVMTLIGPWWWPPFPQTNYVKARPVQSRPYLPSPLISDHSHIILGGVWWLWDPWPLTYFHTYIAG